MCLEWAEASQVKQTVPRAELYALVMIVRSLPFGASIRIGVDAKYLMQGFSRDRSLGASGANGDLWDQYFSILSSNHLSVQFFNVKSHLGYDDIVAGRISVTDLVGNEAADAFAGRGAKLWEVHPADKLDISRLRARAWRIGMRMANVVCDVASKHKQAAIKLNKVDRPQRSLHMLKEELVAMGHSLCFDHDRNKWNCSGCGISFAFNRVQTLALLAKGTCTAVGGPQGPSLDIVASHDKRSQEVHCHPDVFVHDFEPDPFDLGDMDLDGNFDPSGMPAELEQEVVVTSLASSAIGSSERKMLKGQLLLSVGSLPVHTSHRVMYWAGVYYCAKCGCWGTVKTRHLSKPCTQRPSPAGQAALKRLEAGRAPTKPTKLLEGSSARPRLITPGY